MEQFDALEVIARTRGKVDMDERPTGDKMFLIWGWPTVVFFTLMFVLWQLFHQTWCLFVWPGIPLVGIPLMLREMKRERECTHIFSHSSKMVMDYWSFMGAVCGVGGFAFGFAGLGFVCFYPLIGLLLGLGAYFTGKVTRFKPMIIGGLTGAFIGVASFLLQGPLSHWQILCVAIVALISLVIPGYKWSSKI